MHSYEIEIKVLLGNLESKEKFMKAVEINFPAYAHSYTESQKNHYFQWGNLLHLLGVFREYISWGEAQSLHTLARDAKTFSVRTRGTKEETILVVKATVNDESSLNGTARIEWEVDLAPMTLEMMDEKVLAAGFQYQAKWSRSRDEYRLDRDTALCIDKNAWYGYLAEFERVITDESKITETRHELLRMIRSLGYDELDQDRLARMFDFYNKNWRDYYGTEKVFTVL